MVKCNCSSDLCPDDCDHKNEHEPIREVWHDHDGYVLVCNVDITGCSCLADDDEDGCICQ